MKHVNLTFTEEDDQYLLIDKVYSLMTDGRERSLHDIQNRLNHPNGSSISATLRKLRAKHHVEKILVDSYGQTRIWKYKLHM